MKREGYLRKKSFRSILFGTFLVAVSFVILFCVTITARGQSDHDAESQERYYAELEKTWKPEIRRFVEESGYRNAGIMITHVDDGEGNREYRISVHHSRFAKLTDQEAEEFTSGLEELSYRDEDCTVRAELTF